MKFMFRQGENFDSYDELSNQRVRLCNVKPEVFDQVKRNELVEIDFSNDNFMIWNGLITSKNLKNNTICIYLP